MRKQWKLWRLAGKTWRMRKNRYISCVIQCVVPLSKYDKLSGICFGRIFGFATICQLMLWKRLLCIVVLLSVTQVGLWKGRVDRQCIERMKNFQNPPLLVGQVMEMVMTLIGKRLPSQRLEFRAESYPTRDGESGRFSSSSSSTKLTTKKSKCAHALNPSIVPHSARRFSSCAGSGHGHGYNLYTIPTQLSRACVSIGFNPL